MRVVSAEICLRYVDGSLEFSDPYFQSTKMSHRLIPKDGEKIKFHLSMASLMLALYSSFLLCSVLAFALTPYLGLLSRPVGAIAITLLIGAYAFSFYGLAVLIIQMVRYDRLLPTNEVGLSEEGIRLLSFFGRCEKKFMAWDDITSIAIKTGNFPVQSFDLRQRLPMSLKSKAEPYIELKDSKNRSMKIRLSSLRSIEERKILVEMIKQKARRAAQKEDIAQIVQINKMQDLAFTQLWSNALNSSRRRDVHGALEPDALLQEGRFLVKEQIGGGGQGAVYRAEMLENAEAPQVVALKEYVLPDQEHIFDRKRAIDQFEREVRLLTRMRHKSIVQLLDAFIEDQRAYLVMELVNGESLKQKAKRLGGLPEPEAVEVALKICDVLKYLHSQTPQIVHLDLTPENIILAEDGSIKLLDFNTSSDGSGLRTKLLAGKQKYMSPEQFRNEVSPLCDIYAFGSTIFYMLTGTDPEPLTSCDVAGARDGISKELCDLVALATDLEGSRRLQSMEIAEKTLLSLRQATHG